MNVRRHPLALALGATVLVALPGSAQNKGPPTQVWIDVATHAMAGMPDIGAFGGFASRMMGGDNGPQGYPRSRNIPADIGKVLDIAMLNQINPGAPAEQLVPAALGVGKSLPLIAPVVKPKPEDRSTGTTDAEITIHQYWGCGATVRPGQPKTITVKSKGGTQDISGSIAPGVFVPDRDIDGVPPNVLWPNEKNTKRVSDRSSMVGQHRIVGAGVPESLQFELGQNADFMPKVALTTQGAPIHSVAMSWQPVDRARAYFLAATGVRDHRNVVVWSSSEVAGAGFELVNYLTGAQVDKWLKQKVLLPTATTRCAIPQGIFAAPAGGKQDDASGIASLSVVAYGPETNLVWPPKPADPKAPWNPEWNVRVRTKSTASAMLGIDMGGMDASPGEQSRDDTEEKPKKGLLRNLLRSL